MEKNRKILSFGLIGLISLFNSGCSKNEKIERYEKQQTENLQISIDKNFAERYSRSNILEEIDFSKIEDPLNLKMELRQNYLKNISKKYAEAVGRKEGKDLEKLIMQIPIIYDHIGEHSHRKIEEIGKEDKKIFERYEKSTILGPIYIIQKKDNSEEKIQEKYFMVVPFAGNILGENKIMPIFVFSNVFDETMNLTTKKERNILMASYLGHEIYHSIFLANGLQIDGKKLTNNNSKELLGLNPREFTEVAREISEYNAIKYHLNILKNYPHLTRNIKIQFEECNEKLNYTMSLRKKIKKLLLN